MSALARARDALATAVSSTGLACEPYPPDSTIAPSAWIDSISVDYANGASFCGPGDGEAVIIAVGQRNDRAGSLASLEDSVPDIALALEGIDGVRVSTIQSGGAEVGGQTLPAVLFTVIFHLAS